MMFCIYSPLFVAVLEGLNIARGGNIERITTKEKKKSNSHQESLAFITAHQNVCGSICTSEIVRVACVQMQPYMAPLQFLSSQQIIPQTLPYPCTLFEHLRAIFIFWQSTAKGLAMHGWSRRSEMFSTPSSPAVWVFFSPFLKCDLPCDWFLRAILEIMVHFGPLIRPETLWLRPAGSPRGVAKHSEKNSPISHPVVNMMYSR